MDSYHQGLFCSPTEDLEQLARRAKKCTHREGTEEACLLLQKLFHVSPTWIAVDVSSKGLMPWEAAAAWIDADHEGDAFCRIQVRKRLWYPQTEVIAHEMVHAMRAGFQEEQFEEVLAFQTSVNRFRRYFGPLFSKPLETKAFLVALLIPWLLCMVAMLFDLPFDASPIAALPCLAIGWMGLRLYRKQRTFAECLKRVAAALSPSPLAVALRLTDDEIALFSRSTPAEIRSYASAQQKISPRWQQITTFCAGGLERFPA